MVNEKANYFRGAIIFLTMTILMSCIHSPDITGKWQETRGGAFFVLREDHTFSAVDNMGIQVSGKFNLDGRGNIRFEIQHRESNVEIIDAKVTVEGDELIFKFDNTGEIERYWRIEP